MPRENYGILHIVSGDKVLNCSGVFECFKRFKEDREDLQVDPRSGWPSTSRSAENNRKCP
jgi:hypothetical protein